MWRRAVMWRRFHIQSRAAAAAMALNPSAGTPYAGVGKMVANDKVVFMALGAFFGLMFLLFGIHIYVRCIWRRIRTEVIELEDESEEMTRTEVYIREIGTGRRNWRRRLNHYFDERSDSSSPAQHIPSGLDKSVLDLLPTFVFSTDSASTEQMVCAVCLEEFVDGEGGRVLPKCSHCFHVQCIDMWFLSHSSCPLCRCEVSLPFTDTMSNPLLQNSQSGPDFAPDRSEQQQQEPQPTPPPATVTELRDPALPEECPSVSSSLPDAESASIVGARDSNNELYLERGSSLSRRAAAIALEISDHERFSVTEEDQQTGISDQQPGDIQLVIMEARTEGSSSDIPSPVLCQQYEHELHPSTSAAGAPRHLDEDTTITAASSMSLGSQGHARKRSFMAVEINGEYELDASMPEIDSSSIHEVRLQPT
ncbi:unnamed protein product [Calypogeia fissa]